MGVRHCVRILNWVYKLNLVTRVSCTSTVQRDSEVWSDSGTV